MSYEYKDGIIMNLRDYNAGRRVVTGGTNAFESKLSELDHVYEQAAKADEYEAKAKAFDAICKAHVPLEHRMSPVTIDEGLDFAEETEKIILKFYESGEQE